MAFLLQCEWSNYYLNGVLVRSKIDGGRKAVCASGAFDQSIIPLRVCQTIDDEPVSCEDLAHIKANNLL
jgi:hypothetical protein